MLRTVLENQIPSLCPAGVLDAASAEQLKTFLVEAMKAKEAEFGLVMMDIEVRGIYPIEFEVFILITTAPG
jgi:hypothetical protein